MKKSIFIFLLVACSTSLVASVESAYVTWGKDTAYVRVIADHNEDEGKINDFEFPVSYEVYSKVLIPLLKKSTKEEKAYILEREYAKSLQIDLIASQTAMSQNNSALSWIIVIILIAGGTMFYVMNKTSKDKK